MVQHSGHWSTYDSHPHQTGIPVGPQRKAMTLHWLVVPVQLGHEGIRLGQLNVN
jgi:hypothetical protein